MASQLIPFEDMAAFRSAMNDVRANPPWRNAKQKEVARWNPYSFEGGSAAALAGDNFAVIGSDTRLTQFDVNILTRDAKKIQILNDNIVLASTGFYGDVLELRRVFEARLHKFRFDYRKDMTVDMCGQMLARTLYYNRSFPFYTGAILAGVDEKGHGAVYTYDPVGTIERRTYECSGAAEPMMTPFLDNQVGLETFSSTVEKPKLTLDRGISLIKDAFRMAAEREITTGDQIHLVVVAHGRPIREEIVKLRED